MEQSRQAAYDDVLVNGFPLACAAISGLFVGFAVWHPLSLPGNEGALMSAAAAVTALLFGAAALLVRGRALPRPWAHVLAVALAAVAFANIVLHYGLTGQSVLTTNVVLVMVGAGLCLVDPRWTAGLVAALGSSWLLVVGAFDGGETLSTAGPNVLVGAAVAGLSNVVRLNTLHQLLDSQAELRALSQRDELTGLLNRRGFLQAAQVLLDRRRTVQLWFIDVDDLKSVNDSRGHDVGDVLLTSVATALSEVFAGGVVARLAGDEFAVVEDHGSAAGAVVARRALDQRLALASATIGLPMSVSSGSVVSTPGLDLGDLLSAADAAMYADKLARRTIRLPDQASPPSVRSVLSARGG